MKKKLNINALSVAIIVLIVAVLACFVLFTLYHDFGLLGGITNKNTDYTIEFIVSDNENINIHTDKEIYIYNSREYLGIVKGVTYNESNEMVVTVASKGFYKDNTFLLNGKTELAQGSEISIMNNKIQIHITNIY